MTSKRSNREANPYSNRIQKEKNASAHVWTYAFLQHNIEFRIELFRLKPLLSYHFLRSNVNGISREIRFSETTV